MADGSVQIFGTFTWMMDEFDEPLQIDGPLPSNIPVPVGPRFAPLRSRSYFVFPHNVRNIRDVHTYLHIHIVYIYLRMFLDIYTYVYVYMYM